MSGASTIWPHRRRPTQTPTTTSPDRQHPSHEWRIRHPTQPCTVRPGTFHAAGCTPFRPGTPHASGDRIPVPDGVERPRPHRHVPDGVDRPRRRWRILLDPQPFGTRPHVPRTLGPPAPTRMAALTSPHPTIRWRQPPTRRSFFTTLLDGGPRGRRKQLHMRPCPRGPHLRTSIRTPRDAT